MVSGYGQPRTVALFTCVWPDVFPMTSHVEQLKGRRLLKPCLCPKTSTAQTPQPESTEPCWHVRQYFFCLSLIQACIAKDASVHPRALHEAATIELQGI